MTSAELLKLNVNEHTEKKGNLTYLSWAWAWAEAIKADPSATFSVQMFGDSPLCRIGKTALVFVTVKLFGKPLTCQLPVMDNRNKAIADPDAFAVNTAIMRCMTKALALHGLGLYIYAGEDLPDGDDTERKERRAHWLADQFAAIQAASTVGELKRIVAEAVATARSENDVDAEGQILAASATKSAKAKTKEHA